MSFNEPWRAGIGRRKEQSGMESKTLRTHLLRGLWVKPTAPETPQLRINAFADIQAPR